VGNEYVVIYCAKSHTVGAPQPRGAMGTGSALLDFLQITDRKAYLTWCLANHPDKRPEDADATRKFAEVGSEWRRVQPQAPNPQAPKPQAPNPQAPNPFRRWNFHNGGDVVCCAAHVPGTHQNKCYKKVYGLAKHCFYHLPGTSNMRFVDLPPSEFFGLMEDLFRAERTDATCETRCKNGRFCTSKKTRGKLTCSSHDPIAAAAKKAKRDAKKAAKME